MTVNKKAEAKAKEIIQDKHVMINNISFKTLALALTISYRITINFTNFQGRILPF